MTKPILALCNIATLEVETVEQHVRNAVQLLILADERVQVLTIPPDQMLTELIRGAEARCFKALYSMGRNGGAR